MLDEALRRLAREPMRVAAIQHDIVWEDAAATTEHVRR